MGWDCSLNLSPLISPPLDLLLSFSTTLGVSFSSFIVEGGQLALVMPRGPQHSRFLSKSGKNLGTVKD